MPRDRPTDVKSQIQMPIGAIGCNRLAAAFYGHVPNEPAIRRLYPRALGCPTRALATFLRYLLGETDGSLAHLTPIHQRFRIGAREHDAWLRCMHSALQDLPFEASVHTDLAAMFTRAADYLTHPIGSDSTVSPTTCGPAASAWLAHEGLEAVLSAAGAGDDLAAIALADSPRVLSVLHSNETAQVGLISALGRSGSTTLISWAVTRIREQPSLARAHHSRRRTLLHDATAALATDLVKALLELGADANATDAAGHSPLYYASNARVDPDNRACEIARLLIQRGGNVNAWGGVKRCTPLHMAARRGHAEMVAALIEAGADIEARDSLGETPLRRSVNCAQPGAARELLMHGADPDSVGSGSRTPRSAARSPVMHALFAAEEPSIEPIET